MNKITRSDRRFFATTTAICVILLGGAYWWNSLNALPQITIPNPKMPSPNAFDIYAKAYSLNASRPLSLYENYDPKTGAPGEPSATFEGRLRFYRKPELKRWLATNQQALQTLRQGFRYKYLQPATRSFSTLSPHYAKSREMMRTLLAESSIRAAHGDWNGAANSALDIMRLGHDIPRGGPLISAIPGYAHQATAYEHLVDLLPHLNAKTCRNVARRLETLYEKRVKFDVTLTEEKWTMQAGLLEIMQKQNWHKSLTGTYDVQPWKFRFYSKRRLMENYTRHADALIAAAKQPYSKTLPPQQPTDHLLSLLFVPFETTRWSAARTEAQNTLLIVGLALRAYKLKNGTYPNKLDALVPNYLQKIPADPFGSGEPLIYKKQGATYKLWSIGSNKKDDGGLFAIFPGFQRAQEGTEKKKPHTSFYRMQPESKGDYVFGINQ